MTYENEDGVECEGCEFRSKLAELAFGHTRCSVHRPCTGNKYWEPDNCPHCLKLEGSLKDLNSSAKFAQLGKIKSLLNEVQRKVKEREPHKNWEFEPIFEYKFRKLHFFQATQHEQAKTESSEIQMGILNTSPPNTDVLQLDTDDEYQNSEADTEVDNLSFLEHRDHSNNML